MADENMDWRSARQAELQLKGNRLMAEIEELQKKYGLALKAIIVTRDNGAIAEARIVIDFASE